MVQAIQTRLYTLCPQKKYASSIDNFVNSGSILPNSFTGKLSGKFAIKVSLKIPPHQKLKTRRYTWLLQ